MDLKQLKSGSDIRGTAIEGGNLNVQGVAALAVGFADWSGGKKIALGHDSRLTADTLSQAATQALIDGGFDVYFFGLCSTPAMFMSTVLNGADAAIMLTASHHPSDKNGMKFFTKKGGVTSKQLDEIIAISQQHMDKGAYVDSKKYAQAQPNTGRITPCATYVEKDFLHDYCAYMQSIFIRELGQMPLKGFKIAVDAGAGSSGFYATRILQPLGADISGSQYLKPDGLFPFHSPNPEDAHAMKSISKRVTQTKSDMGVIFDADGDRAAVVLDDGSEINRSRLIAMVSAIVLRSSKGGYIVTDSITTEGLKDFIAMHGGTHIRYKRGYQNVISYAKQLNEQGKNAPLAIETSSHAAFKDNYFLDDGAYLAAILIIEAVKLKRKNKTLKSLIEGLKEPLEQGEFRLKLMGEGWKDGAVSALNALNEMGKKYKIASDSFEGVRIYVDEHCLFTARTSVHDPIIAINVESYKKGGVAIVKDLIHKALKGVEGIDLTSLI